MKMLFKISLLFLVTPAMAQVTSTVNTGSTNNVITVVPSVVNPNNMGGTVTAAPAAVIQSPLPSEGTQPTSPVEVPPPYIPPPPAPNPDPTAPPPAPVPPPAIQLPEPGVPVKPAQRFKMKINFACTAATGKYLGAPVAPYSYIEAKLVISSDGTDIPIDFSFPSQIVTSSGLGSAPGDVTAVSTATHALPEGSTIEMFKNKIEIEVPYFPFASSLQEVGGKTVKKSDVFVKSSAFKQLNYATCLTYPYTQWGHGKLARPASVACKSATSELVEVDIRENPGADNTVFTIWMNFVGDKSFCSGRM